MSDPIDIDALWERLGVLEGHDHRAPGPTWTIGEARAVRDEIRRLRAFINHRINWGGSCCPCNLDPDCPGDLLAAVSPKDGDHE